ncbi:hypothetical protein DERF_008697 [Dermatophagoides farinae]|uniref:Uncharacterized protein n=1 Tax=Dermatophagoides farinae TaxID=6954 RepID=A0A922I2Y1_DERFA|nr:hypothetical protein DERF_008697 [Dermatophagoides farinae]
MNFSFSSNVDLCHPSLVTDMCLIYLQLISVIGHCSIGYDTDGCNDDITIILLALILHLNDG